MRVTTTVPGYVALAGVPEPDREAAWTDTYEAAYPEIFETYHSAWGRHERCLAAAADVTALALRIPALEGRVRELIELSERSFRADGLLTDDLDVVLLVGGHTSNGWVTELGDTVTLFLALEFLGEPPYDGVLVSHESFHIAHARHGADTWPEDCAGSLFQEGFAVAISREIHPGLDDSAYLWFDDATRRVGSSVCLRRARDRPTGARAAGRAVRRSGCPRALHRPGRRARAAAARRLLAGRPPGTTTHGATLVGRPSRLGPRDLPGRLGSPAAGARPITH